MDWTPSLPRFALFDDPSPLHRLPRLSAALGGAVDVWIKREDLLPLAFGGNKLRNLEFLVGEALAAGADTLVTSGRRWSNHCRLTAAAGARAGLEVHLVLSGPATDGDGANVRIERLLGATVHVAPSDERAAREELVDRVAADLRSAGRLPFVIGVGGSGLVGSVGQVLAALELARQARSLQALPDVVVLPSATGGTQAGLALGLRLAALPTRVVGVAVAHPAAELRPVVEGLLAELEDLAGPAVGKAAPIVDVELEDGFLGSGYGRPSAAGEEAGHLLATTEGILVDPIYTAKALAWLVDRARRGTLDGRRVVFWHAGGTPGLFEALDRDTP